MFNYRAAAEGHPDARSELESPALLRLEGFPEEYDFHPIGADIVPAYKQVEGEGPGPARLFVINHAGKWSTIEVFDLGVLWVRWQQPTKATLCPCFQDRERI